LEAIEQHLARLGIARLCVKAWPAAKWLKIAVYNLYTSALNELVSGDCSLSSDLERPDAVYDFADSCDSGERR
jgi:hypothetical protein